MLAAQIASFKFLSSVIIGGWGGTKFAMVVI